MKKRITAAVLTVICTLSACGQSSSAEPPEDTPWNNGRHAIMETDKGWYTNESSVDILSLRYTDKESGVQVYLCSRPECMHEGGDSCTATYNDIEPVSTLMYDGSIYFAAYEQDDETAGIALYKAALDGSSLNKVTDVYKVKMPEDDRCDVSGEPFIIHKGYAYIPFELSKRSIPGFGGYIDSGMIRVNIYTGEREEIVSDDEGYFSKRVSELMGCGDYVYFRHSGNKPQGSGTYRYNITTGEITPTLVSDEDYIFISGVTPDKVYVNRGNEETFCLTIDCYDSETFEYLGIAAETEQRNMAAATLFYNDMIFVCGENDIDVYKDGERIGGVNGIDGDFDYTDRYSGKTYYAFYFNGFFKISDNCLYRIRYGNEFFHERVLYYIDRCPLEDIISGTGEFETVIEVTDDRGAYISWGDLADVIYEEDTEGESEDEPGDN
ncbi:MAG: DUF5050 domain-containing protein [Ruminococcus sp.]|nr:DUF5050 domain-containing protein [Ruminococcus sp.]